MEKKACSLLHSLQLYFAAIFCKNSEIHRPRKAQELLFNALTLLPCKVTQAPMCKRPVQITPDRQPLEGETAFSDHMCD